MNIQWNILKPHKLPALFQHFEPVMAYDDPSVIKGKITAVYKVLLDEGVYYIKHYFASGPSRYKPKSRLVNECQNLAFFATLGIPVPTIVAYGEARYWGVFKHGSIVLEEIEGVKDLKTLAEENRDYIRNQTWLSAVLQQVARHTRVLHQHRFIHVDLKWRNILVDLTDSPTVYFIDCPAGKKVPAFLWERGIVKDLACLDKTAKKMLSRTQRLRFYFQYAQISKLNAQHKKRIKKIAQFFMGRE